MKTAVLWDMDGTLVDSEEYHWQSWRQTMQAEGVSLTHQQFLASFGQRNDAILGGWLGASATAATIARIGDAKEICYRSLVEKGGLSPLPGVREWVSRLKAEGWVQAIASSAPRLNVETVLKVIGLEGAFDAIVSAEDVQRGKPDPQVFLTAAKYLGAEPAECIVVEDALAGVEAARRAGMKCISVRLSAAGTADVCVASLEALAPDSFARLLDRKDEG
jgi:beta-phosphoglucomutase